MSQGSEWQPSQQGLEQLVTMFRNANSPDSAIQQQIQLSIKEFQKNVPDFNNYLAFIAVHGKNEQEYVRSVAGLVLKNNIISSFQNLPMEYQSYIRKQVLSCVGDPNNSVRKAIASIITSIVRKVGLIGWPELLPTLMHFLESQDQFLLDGAFQTLSVLCEDYAHEMDNEQLGRPLQVLIPKITLYFKHQSPSIRKHAMNCINQFITAMPHALAAHMEQFLQGTFQLASDTDPDVRRKVCQAFVMLTEVRIDYLVPHMNNVVQYMINATQEQNDDVALEACEFFAAIAESKACKPSLQAFLPQIVPVLLGRMVYSDDDPVLVQVEEDETVADSEKDIKPFFHRSNTKGNVAAPANPAQSSADDEDDEDYDDDDDDEAGDWNIRKCAAAGIDILSLVFQEEILPLILQVVQTRLNNTAEWKVRESAILVLGAISEGCYHGMKSYLPQLVPFLMTFLADNHPLIRSITCWTLSRYAHWIVGQENHEQYLKPIVFQILPRVLDRNKKVQEAACSAFATLEEEAGSYLSPYLGDILQTLMTAFGKYQAKNLLILYDCLGTLADGVRRELNKPEYINMIMPPLIQRWNALSDEDRNLLPLLECLTAIATALGVGFQQFAAPVYQRCMRLIESTLVREEACAREASNPELAHTDYPDLEFLVCSLDVISGIIDGLHTGAESLIVNSNLIRSLLACCQSIRPDVRQSSFAMVGDLSKNCWIHLRPHIHEFLPLIINNIVKDYVQTCNNSVWALGEIALRIGEEIRPYAMPALHKLVPILKLHTKQNLLENVAITIGRIGLVCPDVVSPFLEEFLESWCLILRDTSDDPEKDSAFRGLCKMIEMNPNGAVKHFGFVCDAINSWRQPQTDLKENFNRILHGFKNSMGANWTNYYSTFPPELQKSLSAKYQL